jgi:hypothetical protein
MSYLPVLALLDRMIDETAIVARQAASACPPASFDRLGMGVGANARMQTLNEVKDAVVKLGLREHEQQPDKYYHPDGM